MLSGNPKPSHGSGISQELVIFTLHCIFVETKAHDVPTFVTQSIGVLWNFGFAQNTFWALRMLESFTRGGAAELWSPD